MDKNMLPKDETKAGFRVFKQENLLEKFLRTLKSEIEEAARNKQPVLVLIFGHGEEETFGIHIGRDEEGLLTKTLNREKLASVMKKEVQTSVISTSSSSGWVMKPNWNEHFDVKPTFRQFTAAASENPTLFSSLSQIAGRKAAESIFAAYLLDSEITTSSMVEELNDVGQPTGNMKEILTKIREDSEGEGFENLKYALTKQLVSECKARLGSIWDIHSLSFASEDDLWTEAGGRERTGFPLSEYKEKWESLPEAPLLKTVYPTDDDHVPYPLAGSIMSRNSRALHNIVRVKAARYLNSNPGPNNGGCNVMIHGRLYRVGEGRQFEMEQFYTLNEILDYRWGQICLAELYCYALEIGVSEEQQTDKFHEHNWWRSLHTKMKTKKLASVQKLLLLFWRDMKLSIVGLFMKLRSSTSRFFAKGLVIRNPRSI